MITNVSINSLNVADFGRGIIDASTTLLVYLIWYIAAIHMTLLFVSLDMRLSISLQHYIQPSLL